MIFASQTSTEPIGMPPAARPFLASSIAACRNGSTRRFKQLCRLRTRPHHRCVCGTKNPRGGSFILSFAEIDCGSTHDKILRCRINAAFRIQPERCIYAAAGGALEEICRAPSAPLSDEQKLTPSR